jgi:hypothetical protein
MRLLKGYAHRGDDRTLGALLDQWTELKAAGWDDLDALNVVADLTSPSGLNASPRVIAALCSYPPIAQTLAAHRDEQWVRSFLRDPDMAFEFPA